MNTTAESTPIAPMLPLRNILGTLRADADAAHTARKSGIPRGAVTSLPTLDQELGGALSPGLHTVTGNAGTGKTALALQIAASCGVPCLFVTCEMSPLELLRRHTARVTGTYLGRLKNGELSGADVEAKAREAIEAAPYLAMLDATQYPAPIARLQECAIVVRDQAISTSVEGKFLLVVDSLHSWAGRIVPVDKDGKLLPLQSEYETLNAAIASLQALTAALVCPALLISERNREAMKAGGLNAGAGTRKIEYSGETVVDLDRDPKDEIDGNGEIPVTLRLAKNRNGAAGRTLDLSFNGALQRFRETERLTSSRTGNKGRGAVNSRDAVYGTGN